MRDDRTWIANDNADESKSYDVECEKQCTEIICFSSIFDW